MHHTVAWRESIADIVANDINPVPDDQMLIQNGHFVPTTDAFLQYIYAGGAGITAARLISPTFRQLTNPQVRPINLAIVPLDEANVADYRDYPLLCKGLEELQLEIAQTTGGAAVVVGTAGLSMGPLTPAPNGQVFTMLGTGATTVTAGAWSLITVTWADTLPVGTYACVGCEFVGTTCVAGRLIFDQQWERPGGMGQSLVSGNGPPMFRKGGLGLWGRFSTYRMPNVQFLCNAADTAQTIFLDFVRIG